MPVQEEDAQLVSQCLEFCQTLAGKSQTFSFSLTIGSHLSFSVDTRGEVVLAPKRKKKTPSTLRRDARRREELLKNKFAASTEIKCEQVSEKEAEVPRKAQTVLHHHPSPPASSERRQVTVVGREKVLPSWMGRRMCLCFALPRRRKTSLLWKRPGLMIHLSVSYTKCHQPK